MIGTQSQPQWTGQPSRGEVESITRVQYPFEAKSVMNYIRSPTWVAANFAADFTPEGKNFCYSEVPPSLWTCPYLTRQNGWTFRACACYVPGCAVGDFPTEGHEVSMEEAEVLINGSGILK
jgi:hypothetical protein